MPGPTARPTENKPRQTNWLQLAASDLEAVSQRHFLALHQLQQLQQRLTASSRQPRRD